MGFSFSSSTIETIKEQVNIVDVVGRVVTLKRAGSNYKGVCPFHNEKTPSFVVSETKQIYTCFGCGATGDVIGFVQKYYNLDFPEAVEKIAGEYGITIEKSSYNDNREIYYKVNKLAANFFYKAFTEHANVGYGYMHKRKISPVVLKRYGIGYADEKWDSLYKYLSGQGIDKKIMLELGLISESKGKCYDRFRNRVIFPIINTNGKVIGFGGRAIDPNDNPKYLNSPESRIFQKKNNLYGLNNARQSVGKEDYIILVEGYMDVIALHQGGISNVAASLGTALTENQARLIKRYTKNVVLSYDADGAGRAAALRGIDILRKEGCKVKVLHVNDGKDPDEFIKKNGKDAFLQLIENALPYGDYKLSAAKAGLDLSKSESKIDYMKKAVKILNDMSPVEQDIYIRKLSADLNIAETAIRRELSGESSTDEKTNHQRTHHEDSSNEKITEITSTEKHMLKLITVDESYVDRLREHSEIFAGDFSSFVFNTMCKIYDRDKIIDVKLVMDSLPDNGAVKLQEILDSVIIKPGNEEQVFRECVMKWKDSILADKEKKILDLLSMADEENNQDKINELTQELMQIQKERKHI